MGVLASVRSKLSGQTTEQFGFGNRFPLSKQMIESIRRHLSKGRSESLANYKFERRRSDYSGAVSDIVVYDAQETPVLQGRDWGHTLSFWEYKQ